MNNYFDKLETEIKECYDIANSARSKGLDPDIKVEVPLARDMAERVEGLISIVAPQIKGSGVSNRIKELETEYGSQDWRVALKIAEEVAQEKFCKFKDKFEAMEVGIRVGFSYVTVGVVSSPLEGFVKLAVKKRKDGKEYFCIYYSGPVRSAGGTAASVSVIIADYIRKKMGYDNYDPTKDEIKRTYSELEYYHERVTNLQYFPSEKEAEFMTSHLPLQIDGDASEEIEVPNYKDLLRIESNKIRGGFCLVMAECLCAKAAKLWKQLSKWGKDFGLEHWNFLSDFIILQKEIRSKGKAKQKINAKIVPDYNYIKDVVAGRPILGHPLRQGAFRIRYGRARTSGFSCDAVHPATLFLLDNLIAIGTQLKTERPGKATTVSVCDSIEGPIVKLKDGSVVFVENIEKAKEISKDVIEILFLGDILINYGDFLNRNHVLVPCGYNEDWWALELEKAAGDDKNLFSDLISYPNQKIKFKEAFDISLKYHLPLHPRFTYHWNDINKEQFSILINWLENAIVNDDKIIIPFFNTDFGEISPKRVLELLGIPHIYVNNEYVVIENDWSYSFRVSLGFYTKNLDIKDILSIEGDFVLDIINNISEVIIRDKSGTFLGSRMGRPEKAKIRKHKRKPPTLISFFN